MLITWDEQGMVKRKQWREGSPIPANHAVMVWYDLDYSDETWRFLHDQLHIDHSVLKRCYDRELRSRLEATDTLLTFTLPWISRDSSGDISTESVRFILERQRLITVHSGDVSPFLKLSEVMPERVFKQGTDALTMLLAKELIQPLFTLLDNTAEAIDDLESQILDAPRREVLEDVFHLRKDLLTFRRGLAPAREVFTLLAREERKVMDPEVIPEVIELYDRVIGLHETIDLHRDLVANATEIYLSTISNRMNEKMTMLTIVSTIILPLTLIVGYYGMNFQTFPELSWHHGLLFVWGLMLGVAGLMVIMFRRRKWF